MSDSRSEILIRIQQALSQAYLPDGSSITGPPPQPPPFDRPLVEVFVDVLKAVQGVPHIVEDEKQAIALCLNQLQDRGVTEVLGWEAKALAPAGMADALGEQGIVLVESRLQGLGRKGSFERWSDIEVGITGAQAGLARTGSIVLTSDADHGRLPSLLPPVHFALLYAKDIYADLAAWIGGAGANLSHSSNTVVITGPSRSADIAQTLTLGAHGPRELHVVIILNM